MDTIEPINWIWWRKVLLVSTATCSDLFDRYLPVHQLSPVLVKVRERFFKIWISHVTIVTFHLLTKLMVARLSLIYLFEVGSITLSDTLTT